MVWKGFLSGGIPFKDDQERILNWYFNKKPGRIVVSAGAGTGKTTLLVEIYAEAAVRLFSENPTQNPFEKILAVTFTVEATRQMKNKVRARLEKHFKAMDDEDSLVKMLQWLESESKIYTLDSLTRELLADISLEAGLNPLVTVPDEYELSKVKENIINKIQEDAANQALINILAQAYPDFDWRGDSGWKGMIDYAFIDSRQYGLNADEFRENAEKTFDELYLHNGERPTQTSIREIFSRLSIEELSSNLSPDRVNASYDHNKKILDAFCKILSKYEELYDFNTTDKGWVGHDDARFWLVRYMKGLLSDSSNKWINAQKGKYLHILVDEFQDTSYAQCEMIKHFISPNTNVFLIGDPKQAIYQWRSADPEIFLDIIASVPSSKDEKVSGKIPHLDVDGFKMMELVSNYRSNDDLIKLFNEMFGQDKHSIFEDKNCTKGYPIPHSNLKRSAAIPEGHKNDSHIHLITGEDEDTIPNILQEIMLGKRILYVREGEGDKSIWRKAEPGDCCILMQSRGTDGQRWENLRRKLVDRGIRYVMLAEKGLFSRPEISLLIDIMDWLGSPHQKDPLVRILRSPLVGLSDRSIRYLASHNFNINSALDDSSKPEWFDKDSGALIQGLIYLRDDLRWMREGKKSEMVEKILRYSHLDTTLLAYIEGELCLANIRYFQEVIATWEEEELLQYPVLIERLKYFRESGSDAYNMAVMADETDKSSVRIATVHAVKGLEFPIVFHYYTKLPLDAQIRMGLMNDKYYIQKFGKFIALRQVAPPRQSSGDWEKYFAPSLKVRECVMRTDHPLVYDNLVHEVYAEKWRLYYVAMTRAKDHIYHNMDETTENAVSWLAKFRQWCAYHERDENVEIIPPQRPVKNAKMGWGIKKIRFDEEGYKEALEKSKTFTPRSLNPSHLYDLIYCPRYYQYSVLQNVRGGPHDQYGVPTDYDSVRFGKHVHKALELRDFTQTEPNKEYNDYIGGIFHYDKKEAERVKIAVAKFMNSAFFKEYELAKRRTQKEYSILFALEGNGLEFRIFMDDQIDLIVEDPGKGVIIVDYKTNYPIEDNPGAAFLKNHYEIQLASYVLALEEGLGLNVSKTILMSYDPHLKNPGWIKQEMPKERIDVKKEISKLMPLKIVKGGLEKCPDIKFCEEYCEFVTICKPFGKK